MWIIDGFDQVEAIFHPEEKKEKNSSMDKSFVEETIFSFKNVILTSKPEYMKNYKIYTKNNTTLNLKVKGFQEYSKIRFLDKYFSSDGKKYEIAKKTLTENSYIFSKMNNPLYIDIFCFLIENERFKNTNFSSSSSNSLSVNDNIKIGDLFDSLFDITIDKCIKSSLDSPVMKNTDQLVFKNSIKTIFSLFAFYIFHHNFYFISKINLGAILNSYLNSSPPSTNSTLDSSSFDFFQFLDEEKKNCNYVPKSLEEFQFYTEFILKCNVLNQVGNYFHFEHTIFIEFLTSYFIYQQTLSSQNKFEIFLKYLNSEKVKNSNLPLFLCYFNRKNISNVQQILDCFFAKYYNKNFYAEKNQKTCKDIAECLNEIESKENLSLIFSFLQNFKKDNITWKNRIIFQYSNLSEFIKFIVENKVNLNMKDKYGKTVLHLYFKNENYNFNILKNLIDNNCDLNCKDNDQYSPIYYFSFNRNVALEPMKYIVEKKANFTNTLR